jgi:hypothetical protein
MPRCLMPLENIFRFQKSRYLPTNLVFPTSARNMQEHVFSLAIPDVGLNWRYEGPSSDVVAFEPFAADLGLYCEISYASFEIS